MQQQEKVQNILLWKSGMYDKIFWKLLEKVVFREDIEDIKTSLKEMYWFEDVDKVFPSKIDKARFAKINRVINNYQDLSWNENQNE